VKRHRPDHLYVEMALAQDPFGSFADGGEGFDEDVLERFPGLEALAELDGLAGQFGIVEGRNRRLQGIDLADQSLKLAQGLALAGLEDLGKNGHGRRDAI
jgi:hypothetical protein